MNSNRLPEEFREDPEEPTRPIPEEVEISRHLKDTRVDAEASQEYQKEMVHNARVEAASLLVKCPKWIVVGVSREAVAPNVEERSYLLKYFDSETKEADRSLKDFEDLLKKALDLIQQQIREEEGRG